MKRIIAIVLMTAMMMCGISAYAEEADAVGTEIFDKFFRLDQADNCVFLNIEKNKFMVFSGSTCVMMICSDMEENTQGWTMKEIKALFGDNMEEEFLEMLVEDYGKKTDMMVTNGISWVGFSTDVDGETVYGAACTYENAILQMIFLSGEDTDGIAGFMERLHPVGDDAPVFEDRTLVCKECGKEFTFTAGEQEFYAERGFLNEPQRCKECRDARKNATKGERSFYTAFCSSCGAEIKLPFQPKSDRPVFCSDCFAEMRDAENVS